MTETNENEEVLARVRAVVMEREDDMQLWDPSGALSYLSVVKRSIPLNEAHSANSPNSSSPNRHLITNDNTLNTQNPGAYEYVIYGHSIPAGKLLFRCVIDHTFIYRKVMPTFHNWIAGNEKVGVVFQTAADGRVFDKGVHSCLVEIIGEDGLSAAENAAIYAAENEPVLEVVELPKNNNNYCISNSGQTSSDLTYISSPSSGESGNIKTVPLLHDTESRHYMLRSLSAAPPIGPYSYVNAELKPTLRAAETSDSLKKGIPRNTLNDEEGTLICRYCRKTYVEEENVRGSCDEAPDCIRKGVDTVTCIPCARSMMHHCMSDAEDEFAQPCNCDRATEGCRKRWLSIALLSLFLPCMCCYPLLKLCHLCGVSCGVCGGRHQPIRSMSSSNTR